MSVERFKHMISVWRFKKTIVERFSENDEC